MNTCVQGVHSASLSCPAVCGFIFVGGGAILVLCLGMTTAVLWEPYVLLQETEKSGGWKDSTIVARTFALHTADLSLISAKFEHTGFEHTLYATQSSPGVMTEYKAGVSPEYHQM